MIDIRSALTQALLILDKTDVNAHLEAEILLSHLLEKNRAYLFTYPEQMLSATLWNNYQELLQLRAQGVPIAYLTGYREFWSLPLKVNNHTLIPRHETEQLVELALALLPKEEQLNILDLGTGSGAIALAIASERPQWRIIAVDYSFEALAVAQENAQKLQITNVRFQHSNWFSAVPQQQYDAIISNPPYINQQDPHLLQGDVRFEPISALASGQEGLADLEYIIEQGYNYLKPNGLILLEHGHDQKVPVRAILNKLGYQKICCWQDIAGHDRVSGGCKSI